MALPVGQFISVRGTNNTLRQVVVIEATLDHQLTGQAWPQKRAAAEVGLQSVPNNGCHPVESLCLSPYQRNTEVAEKAKKRWLNGKRSQQAGKRFVIYAFWAMPGLVRRISR